VILVAAVGVAAAAVLGGGGSLPVALAVLAGVLGTCAAGLLLLRRIAVRRRGELERLVAGWLARLRARPGLPEAAQHLPAGPAPDVFPATPRSVDAGPAPVRPGVAMAEAVDPGARQP
jgi:hypothetical protein